MNEKAGTNRSKLNQIAKAFDILESISDGFFALDRDWRFTYVNKQAASNLGLQSEDIIGQNIWDKFPQFNGGESELTYRKAMAEGQPRVFEVQGPVTSQWHNVRVYPSANGISVYWQDITERKMAEETLKESENTLKLLWNTISRGVVYQNSEGKVIRINPAAERILGRNPEHYLEKTLEESENHIIRPDGSLFPENEHPSLLSLKTGQEINDVVMGVYNPKEKSYRWINISAVPLFLPGEKKPYQTYIIFDDITERKKAEESLKLSEEKYRSVVENANEAIVIAQDGKAKFFNSRLFEITGYSAEEIKVKPFLDFIQPEDRNLLAERYRRRIKGEAVPASYEYRVVSKNGSTKWMQMNAALITLEGRPATLNIFADITERKQAEEALTRYKDELETKVKERTEQLQEAYDEIMNSQKALKEANKQLKQYANRITQVQEEERKRIAYELHDDTAQYLSILKMQIGALADSKEIRIPKVKEKLHFLEKDADRAFNDVRRYSHELRPTTLEHQGLVAALEQIADDFNKLGQLSVEVHIEGMEPELSEEVKLGFFRIAQEALNNTRKHAKASQAEIGIQFNHKQLNMTVSDNGEGFNTKNAM